MSTIPSKRPRVKKASRQDNRRIGHTMMKEAEKTRITLVCGCQLIGWWDADVTLQETLHVLEQWSYDPDTLARKGWPFDGTWEWDVCEEMSVWHAGRLIAVVAQDPRGGIAVRYLDGKEMAKTALWAGFDAARIVK